MNYVIHCFGHDGSILGYRDEDDAGRPLTKRAADRLARQENQASARRKAIGAAGPSFSFAVAQKGGAK